jgi:hypothetical protein
MFPSGEVYRLVLSVGISLWNVRVDKFEFALRHIDFHAPLKSQEKVGLLPKISLSAS